jgi:hypothetical protein
MVEVPVGTKKMNGLQVLLLDIVYECLAFFWKIGATIDDDTLLCIIAHHVGVFLQHIKDKNFNVEHKQKLYW